jgi:hypothetical protein
VTAGIEQVASRSASSSIRWTRAIVAGILLELALVAVLVPIGAIFGAPPGLGRNQTGNYGVFFTAVPLACFVLGYSAGWIGARQVRTRFVAHGLLVGVTATTFYLLMTSLNPQGGLPAAIDGYGTIHFWGTQIARIAGATLGGVQHRKGQSRPA